MEEIFKCVVCMGGTCIKRGVKAEEGAVCPSCRAERLPVNN